MSNKKLILVESIVSFRNRYVVEIKDGDPNEWAMDTVACDEAVEFSQYYLGDHISSHREISLGEAVRIFKEDSPSLTDVSLEYVQMHITPDPVKPVK